MMRGNLHTHSNYCDGKSTLEETVQSAISKGFSYIGFSGHENIYFDGRYCMCLEGEEKYRTEVNSLKEKYKDKILVLCGLESDEDGVFSPEALFEMIKGRKTEKKEGSYTTYLFEKGIDKILKKVGEECTEVIIASKDNDKKETIYEIADLAYHIMVMMTEMGISVEDISKELASRHVIDHKVKQEKMTK